MDRSPYPADFTSLLFQLACLARFSKDHVFMDQLTRRLATHVHNLEPDQLVHLNEVSGIRG